MTRLENFKAFVFNDDDGNSIDLPSVNIISLTGWRHILQHNSYPSPTMKIDCLLWRIYKIANLQAMLLTVLINYLRWRNPLPCLEFFIEAGAFWNNIKDCIIKSEKTRLLKKPNGFPFNIKEKEIKRQNHEDYNTFNLVETISEDIPGIPGIIKFGSFRTSWSVLFSPTFTHLEPSPVEH